MAGAWLILGGLAHFGWHVWTLVYENGMIGLRDFAANAMQQARSPDPLQPSLWRQFRAFSSGFGLLLLFTGAVDWLMASRQTPDTTLKAYAVLATVFWAVAFVPYAFVDPIIQALVITALAVPMHGIVYLLAALPEDRDA